MENLSIPFTHIQLCITLIDHQVPSAVITEIEWSNHPVAEFYLFAFASPEIRMSQKWMKRNEEIEAVVRP